MESVKYSTSYGMFIFYRPGSVVAIVQLQFHKYSIDPLKPLRDDIADGKLGAFIIEKHLDVNPCMSSFYTLTHNIGKVYYLLTY